LLESKETIRLRDLPGFAREVNMCYRACVVQAMLLAALAAAALPSAAQIPPHAPGTVCATPKFWCWARYPGPPGTKCACSLQGGWQQGVLV